MKLPAHFTSRAFLVIGFSVALYAVGAAWLGWPEIRRHLAAFPPPLLAALAGLSLANYALRCWRWEIYLRALGVRLPGRLSLGLYFSAYVMVITPGKLGEVFKAGILRERFGVPLALGLPAVLAERVYDFLAVVLLAGLGWLSWNGPLAGRHWALAALALVPALLALFRSRSIRSTLLGRAAGSQLLARHRLGLDEALAAFQRLLTVPRIAFSLALTTLAWGCECAGLWVACRGLGIALPLDQAGFIYAAGTLVGSLSFLPGGLGGTEATMIWLLGSVGLSAASAATVSLLVRLFTLWLAVVLGLGFFLACRRSLLAPGGPLETNPAPGGAGS